MSCSSMLLTIYPILFVAAPGNSRQSKAPDHSPTDVREKQPSAVDARDAQFVSVKPPITSPTSPPAQPMWTDTAQALCSIATFFVAVFGFALVIRQLMQVETALRKDALESLYERAFSIQSIILQDPQLRPLFYDNAPVPSDTALLAKLETFSEMVFDFYELIVDEQTFMSADLSQTWKVYLVDLYGRSPILRRHLERNPTWYSNALCKSFQQHNPT